MLFIDIKNLTNIFDIMAIAYNQIKEKYTPKFRDSYIVTDYGDIFKIFALYWENKNDCILLQHLGDILSEDEEINDRQCYAIIEAIDLIPYTYQVSSGSLGLFREIDKLNPTTENVIIYPRPHSSIIDVYDRAFKKYDEENGEKDESKRGLRDKKDYKYSIRENIKNYDIIEVNELHSYIPILHTYADNGRLLNNFRTREALKIALVPFIGDKLDKLLDLRESINSFWIEGAKDGSKETIIHRYTSILKNVLEEDVDFIIFPEMILINEAVPYIIEEIDKCQNNKSQLVFAGTLWENDENKCYVFDKTSRLIFEQHKQKPFKYKRKKEERLNCLDKRINIIDIDGLGRIFTFICKDIDDEELIELPKKLHADIVILPSYTKSMDLQSNPEVLAARFQCITIMSNSCSAINGNENDNTIGFSCFPAKKRTRRISKVAYYSQQCKNCNNMCNYQILTIKPSVITEEEDITSCFVDYIS